MLKNSFLYSTILKGIDADSRSGLEKLLCENGCEVLECKNGQEISLEERAVIVESGKVDIRTVGKNGAIIRTANAGEVIGIGMLYANVPAPKTHAAAHGRTRVLVIPRPALDALMFDYPLTAQNIIGILSDKITILNKRILTFTAVDAQTKVAIYLYDAARELNSASSGEITLSDTYTALAKKLDVGRASLYRALDDLEAKGIISRCGQKITIRKLDELKEIKENKTERTTK